jgi:hypothetical protein
MAKQSRGEEGMRGGKMSGEEGKDLLKKVLFSLPRTPSLFSQNFLFVLSLKSPALQAAGGREKGRNPCGLRPFVVLDEERVAFEAPCLDRRRISRRNITRSLARKGVML